VTISKSTEPKAKMSERASASLPSSCSGGHVLEGADDGTFGGEGPGHGGERGEGAGRGGGLRFGQLGEAEIQQLDHRAAAGARQHDVAGLEVAMDDVLAVRLVERLADLDGDAVGIGQRQRAAGEAFGEGSPSTYSMTRYGVPSCAPTSWSVQMLG
jgi:hypothetical protein